MITMPFKFMKLFIQISQEDNEENLQLIDLKVQFHKKFMNTPQQPFKLELIWLLNMRITRKKLC